jgi:predicted outer membrane lipoprotein
MLFSKTDTYEAWIGKNAAMFEKINASQIQRDHEAERLKISGETKLYTVLGLALAWAIAVLTAVKAQEILEQEECYRDAWYTQQDWNYVVQECDDGENPDHTPNPLGTYPNQMQEWEGQLSA